MLKPEKVIEFALKRKTSKNHRILETSMTAVDYWQNNDILYNNTIGSPAQP